MTTSPFTTKAQEQTLSAVRTAQDTVLELVKPYAALTEPIFEAAAALPFSDQVPSVTGTVEQWFDFAAEVLAAQKDFSLSLLGLMTNSAPAPKPKSAPKAA